MKTKAPYPLIGVCGLAGSGKDTAADHLKSNYGFGKMSLADKLKQICGDVFDWPAESLWGPSEKRNKPDARYPRSHKEYEDPSTGKVITVEDSDFLTPRYALQQLGTEWGRNCYPNIWVDVTLRTADKVMTEGYIYEQFRGPREREFGEKPYRGMVIPDVRFKNEVAAIKNRGGQVWRIRPSNMANLHEWQLHPSETEQLSIPDSAFDRVIINDINLDDPEASLRHLHLHLDQIMKEIL